MVAVENETVLVDYLHTASSKLATGNLVVSAVVGEKGPVSHTLCPSMCLEKLSAMEIPAMKMVFRVQSSFCSHF